MSRRDFNDAERMGRLAEYVVAYFLRKLGRQVFHHGGVGEQDFEGRKLMQENGNVILPDLSWFKWEENKQAFYWGDVKAKRNGTWNRMRKQWETGCELGSLEQYRWVSAVTVKHCLVFFLHLRTDSPVDQPIEGYPGDCCPTGLFCHYTQQLSSSGHWWQQNGMLYWPMNMLMPVASLAHLLTIPKCAEYLKQMEEIL